MMYRTGTVLFFALCVLSCVVFGQSITADTMAANHFFEQGEELDAKGLFHQAHDYYMASDSLWAKHFDLGHPSRLKTNQQLANNHKHIGDYTNALKVYKKILEVLDQSQEEYVSVQHNIGSIYKDLYDTHNAQETFEWILQNRIERYGEKHPKVVSAYIKIGANCNDFGDSLHYQQGLDYLNKALVIQEQLDGKKGAPYYYIKEEIAEIYRSMGRYKEAITLLKNVLKYREANMAKNDVDRGDAHFYLAKNYLKTKAWDKALYHISQDLEILSLSNGQQHPYVADNFMDRAFILRHQKKYSDALKAVHKAIRILVPNLELEQRRQFDKDLLEVGHFQQLSLIKMFNEEAEILAAHSDSKEYKMQALQALECAITLIDEVRQVQLAQGSKIALQANNSHIFEKAISLSLKLWESTHDRRYFEKAFTILEKSKVATLREVITAKSAFEITDIPKELSEEMAFLKARIGHNTKRKYELKREAVDHNQELIRINNQLFDYKSAYNKLIASIEEKYPKYYNLKFNTKIAELPATQELLAETNAQLIEYYIGKHHPYAFYITADNLDFRKTALPPNFETDIANFINKMRDGSLASEQGNSKTLFKSFTKDAHDYYQLLLSDFPLKSDLRLLIVPDGILNLLPFDALISELPLTDQLVDYSGLHFLLKDYPISYEYAMSLQEQYLKKEQTNTSSLAAFAPKYEISDIDSLLSRPGFTDLEFIENEAQGVANLSNGKTYLQNRATESMFKKNAAKYDVLHLAMHAFTDDEDPTFSGLIFTDHSEADDDILHAYELSNMNLNAKLAVLSACNTGRGKLVDGEGVMSLARAFRIAGCHNVVMSLWQADDQATQQIMLDFYEQLRNGLPKDKALQIAKLTYLNKDRKNFPYYWSAFVLLGDNEPIDFANSLSLFWSLIIPGLLGVYFLFRKYS